MCEPAGNLVKRDILTEHNVAITGRSAYEKSEFLASTDERFRPVNAYTAPDGALYVVDMYRGVVQHRVYITSYLRDQSKQRGLEQPLHQGRIYRVIHEGTPRGPAPHLSKSSSADLVNLLSHPNGWWRDTAQRLLVERSDVSVVPALQAKATADPNELGRIHALWTLEGMGALDKQTVMKALGDSQPKVRAVAIRMAEELLKTPAKPELLTRLVAMSQSDLDVDTQLQLAFTLGQVSDPQAEQGMTIIAKNSCSNAFVREALISGLVVRELEFLEKLLADRDWQESKPGRSELLSGWRNVFSRKGKAQGVEPYAGSLAAGGSSTAALERHLALLDGMAATPQPFRESRREPASGQSQTAGPIRGRATGILDCLDDKDERRASS